VVVYQVKRKKKVFAGGMNFTTLNLLRVKISVSIVDCRLQNGKEKSVQQVNGQKYIKEILFV
jgi:hypothetical protein